MILLSNLVTLEECKRKLTISIQRHSLDSGLELKRVQQAIEFAEKAHEGQLRKSGVPYIIHPLRMALTASEYLLDIESIIVCLLHDVIEDSNVSPETIEEKFGPTVLHMVKALTKVKESQNLTWYKIIEGGMYDVRIIIIKLIDRLDNLLEIKALRRAKQKKITRETLLVYSEIAEGLGTSELATELRNRSYACLYPQLYARIASRLAQVQASSEGVLEIILKILVELLPDTIIDSIRPEYTKVSDLILNKSYQNVQKSFDKIIIKTKEVEDCYKVLGLLHTNFVSIPLSLRDYVSNPMANGWRALITQVVIDGIPMTFHIMTSRFYNTNRMGVLALMREKTYTSALYKNFLEIYFDTLHDASNRYKDLRIDDIFLRNKQKLIQVFTEKGDIKEFRYGATVLDFAFSIHTEVGLHCSGGVIDQVFYPSEKLLEDGMFISVQTDPHIFPTQDWLQSVVMPKSRREILKYLTHKANK